MKNFVRVVAILIILAAICIMFLGTLSGCAVTRFAGTYIGNKVDYIDQKINDATNYETRKTVEDSCRAMVSSYEADKLVWEQYKESENSEERSWANQAKMRANRTASTYNNYVLKNSYVWDGNIPADILSELKIIE